MMNFRIKGNFLSVRWLLTGVITFMVVGLVPLSIHVVWCIQMAAETGSAIALLIVGLLLFPVGWVHGMSILLGFGGWL